jgi:topoisomerase IA-like protein
MAGQNIATITFEEALELFRLPFDLNEVDGQPVSVGVGRFGPYVKWGELYQHSERRRSAFCRSETCRRDHQRKEKS